jgi:hypothetical protein
MEPLESKDSLVTMAAGTRANEGGRLFGQAEVVVDASIEKVAAWMLLVDSRYSKEKKHGPKYKVSRENEHFQTVKMEIGADLKFEKRKVWKVIEDGSDGGKKKISVFGSPVDADRRSACLWSMTECEELESKGDVKQTKVVLQIMVDPRDSKLTSSQRLDLINTRLSQRLDLVKSSLSSLCDLRQYYERDRDVDAEERRQFMKKASKLGEIKYTDEELDVLEQGRWFRVKFENARSNQVKSNSPMVKFELMKGEGTGGSLGRASATIRASNLEVSCC